MPNLTEEEKREFPREIIEILDNHSAELTAAGFDPAALKVELTTLADTADAKEGDQVTARAAHATATAESQPYLWACLRPFLLVFFSAFPTQ